LVLVISQYKERKNYEEASKHPWHITAMNKEIEALIANNTLGTCGFATSKKGN